MPRRTPLWVALAALTAIGCAPAAPAQEAPAKEGPKVEKLLNVEVAKIVPRRFRRELVFLGDAQPIRSAIVAAEVPGRIVSLTKDKDDKVVQGEVVARIDTRGVDADIDHAEANLAAAHLRLKRLRPLRKDHLVAEGDVEDAELALRAAKALLKRTEVQRSLAKVQAPIDGVVIDRFAEPGEHAAPGAPLLSLADLSVVEVRIHVPEDQVRLLENGKPVRASVPAVPELGEMEAKVARLGKVGDPRNRTYPVDALLPNAGGRIRAGMLIEARVTEIDRPDAVVAPRDAIVEGRDGKVAYVVVDGVARARPVTLGPSVGEDVWVKSGLVAGDMLIVRGQMQVVGGERVQVIKVPEGVGEQAGAEQRAP